MFLCHVYVNIDRKTNLLTPFTDFTKIQQYRNELRIMAFFCSYYGCIAPTWVWCKKNPRCSWGEDNNKTDYNLQAIEDLNHFK